MEVKPLALQCGPRSRMNQAKAGGHVKPVQKYGKIVGAEAWTKRERLLLKLVSEGCVNEARVCTNGITYLRST